MSADQLNGPGNVSVLNSERLNNANGTLKVIHGYATPAGEPGKFTVHLETVPVGAACKWLVLAKSSYMFNPGLNSVSCLQLTFTRRHPFFNCPLLSDHVKWRLVQQKAGIYVASQRKPSFGSVKRINIVCITTWFLLYRLGTEAWTSNLRYWWPVPVLCCQWQHPGHPVCARPRRGHLPPAIPSGSGGFFDGHRVHALLQ